jgi:hypothetical protein
LFFLYASARTVTCGNGGGNNNGGVQADCTHLDFFLSVLIVRLPSRIKAKCRLSQRICPLLDFSPLRSATLCPENAIRIVQKTAASPDLSL